MGNNCHHIEESTRTSAAAATVNRVCSLGDMVTLVIEQEGD